MKEKKIIIFLSILVIIAIIIISTIFILLKNINKTEISEEDSPELYIRTDLMKLKSSKVLFTVEDIISDNTENLSKVYIEDAYYKDSDTSNQTQLYLYTTIWTNDFSQKEKNYIIITLNEETMQYNIKIEQRNITKQQYEDIIETLKSEPNNENDQIEYDETNIFEYKNVTNEDIVQRYVEYFITLELYSPEDAYELIEENYKTKRFENIDNFKKYISDNKNFLELYTIEKYAVNYKDNYTEYIAIDIYDNYYIIQEKELLDFSIQLDNYTIESQEYIDKYNTLSNEQKVSVSVTKVIKMINTADYKNLYNIIDETYKQNNFPTQEIFETYIKNKFFKYNILEECQSSFNTNAYICDFKIKSGNNSTAEEKQGNIIIRLEENTAFKISFMSE